MSVGHLDEIEVFLPVGLFFGKRPIAETGLNPNGDAGGIDSRFFHIVNVFVPGDRALPERLLVDGAEKGPVSSRFYFCPDQIPHREE
jgi:hypothetical protein